MMRNIFRFLLCLAFCLCALSSLPAPCAAQIVVNEFVADPARDWDGDGTTNLRDDEWIEIRNIGTVPVDLSAYRLADAEGPTVFRYGFAGTLDPGAVRVVYGSDSRAWEEANGFPLYGLSLNNTGDVVSLYRLAGGDTALVDSYAYREVAARDDRSIGRRSDAPSVWITFDALNPCTATCDPAGTGCFPTPGSQNTCLTPAATATWGSIKGIYIR
ncbi:MAG: lamin tail domain-containing protein [Candidatus Latescibacterota bacterium]|jgi:hypothetical protein|nr:MAG: lamin tail domain-containing protein [Candidatus Latescibacterota bacterium]